ncbi:MAG TPA: alpha/beta fold hydrolase [Thermomicrobiales bacterium]
MPDRSLSESGVAEINGARLAYDLAGEGPVLVLMHAGICDRQMWDDQFAAFARNHRVLRYDVRGFGASNLPPGSYAHHDDLRALLDALAIERATLVAASMAGGIALKTALTYPERVNALVLSTTGAATAEPTAAVRQLWGDADAAYETGDIAKAVEIELRGWVDGPHRSPAEVDAAVRERVRVMNAPLWERIADEPDAGEEAEFAPPVHERLGEVRVPTLLIVGELDQPYIVGSMERLATTIPGAETVVVRGTAHLPSMERPVEFNRVVLDFLERRGL